MDPENYFEEVKLNLSNVLNEQNEGIADLELF